MAGSCDFCQAHVTSGEFDWVLSRIEQDESYRRQVLPPATRLAAWFGNAVVSPFVDFFARNRAWAFVILAFIAWSDATNKRKWQHALL